MEIPRATYRIQLNSDCTFETVRRSINYFDELGISHLYLSPFLLATPGSRHGYDVTDYSKINPEIGTEQTLQKLSEELHKRKMGILMDIVPNHMCVTHESNRWWSDQENYRHYFDFYEGSDRFRRFFDIDSLAGMRCENPEVFAAIHKYPLELIERGLIQGLRVDHIDGLYDPVSYLHQLREAVGTDTPLFVEKILMGEERLPPKWPVQGTTGYDFLNLLNALFIGNSFEEIFRRYTRITESFGEILLDAKKQVLHNSFAFELSYFTDKGVDIEEVLLNFPVYRSYIQNDSELFMRFQQFTGPLMAKGFEDTALYRYHPLSSCNEVGGDPLAKRTSWETFHNKNLERLKRWPHTLLTTTTHDTKRSEDVRARLNALSHHPQLWEEHLTRWDKTLSFPSRTSAYLFFQTAIGTWPRGPDPIVEYMLKSAKEAKQQTSWQEPNKTYEKALEEAVRNAYANETFCKELSTLVSLIQPQAETFSLQQLLLKMTVPGIPDFYQGQEEWNPLLVDPDNRGVVDFTQLDQNSPKALLMKKILTIRRSHPKLFSHGDYIPLGDGLFARSFEGQRLEVDFVNLEVELLKQRR